MRNSWIRHLTQCCSCCRQAKKKKNHHSKAEPISKLSVHLLISQNIFFRVKIKIWTRQVKVRTSDRVSELRERSPTPCLARCTHFFCIYYGVMKLQTSCPNFVIKKKLCRWKIVLKQLWMNHQFWNCFSFWMVNYYFRSMPTASTKFVNLEWRSKGMMSKLGHATLLLMVWWNL